MRFDGLSLKPKLPSNSSRVMKKKPSTKFNPWYLIILVLIITLGLSFFYFGKLGAEYLVKNVEPISLFGNGKYLVLLQNNAEERSSGGFIGTYAVLTIQNLEIKKIDFNTNIYALDRTFSEKYYAQAPAPLAIFLKNKTWTLRDSNYDASFPEASQDILFFYNKETNDNVDGIIALNAKVMVDLLKLTGPIKLDKYNLTVTADNFYDVTQYQVEKAYFEDPQNQVINEPKTFLKDLYPEIINRALKDKITFLKTLRTQIDQKEILFYFTDPEKQKISQEHNWAGEIPSQSQLASLYQINTPIDYVYLNQNSYSGDKSSIKMRQTVDYHVESQKDGTLLAKLRLNLVHIGSFTWPDGANDTWLRVIVPKDSHLVSATINERDIPSQDLTIGSEVDKTFFGYKVFTNPGQANILEFTYKLPFKTKDYHLLVQKQPGAQDMNTTISFNNLVLYNGILNKDIQM